MPEIFEYLDYRQFLRDLYAAKKRTNRHFSYRYLAHKTGLKSPGFFTWVLQGKRNLSPHLVLKFAAAFKMNKRETAFFEMLVAYNQSKTHEEKKHHFDKISRLRRSQASLVRPDQYAYFDQWHHIALREYLSIKPFHGDYAALAKALIPSIPVAEARKSVELLERLGLVRKCEDGAYRLTEASVTTGEQWRSLAVHHFQHQTLDLAKRALDQFPKEQRNISTLTVSCSRETFSMLQEKVQALRQEIVAIVTRDEHPESVFQCNFQLFPLTWPEANGDAKKPEEKAP